jgi:hypothetical protein
MNKPTRQSLGMELGGWQLAIVFLFACAVVATRRPDAVFHAQFWAEDGRNFYANAYDVGWWPAIFRTYDGYFHLVPRLGASFALLAPLSSAPFVTNLIAIAVQAIPASLLLSARCAGWGGMGYRLKLAGIYLALPNSADVGYGIANSQWLLALSAFLLLVASAPRGWVSRLFDLAILIFSGLSGPFCLFLLPIAVFLAVKRRTTWRWVPVGVLAVCSLAQTWGLLVADRSGRPHSPLGASLALFTRILAGQIYFGALLGRNFLSGQTGSAVFAVLACAAVAGTVLVAVCSLRSGLEMKLFLVLTAMIFIASLSSPTAYPPPGVSRWELLANVPGIRYWFFPTLAFAWSVLWAAHCRVESLRLFSVVLLCLMCFGVIRDWRQPALKDLQFSQYAKSFGAAPPGTVMIIPENPVGWEIRLVKHP